MPFSGRLFFVSLQFCPKVLLFFFFSYLATEGDDSAMGISEPFLKRNLQNPSGQQMLLMLNF